MEGWKQVGAGIFFHPDVQTDAEGSYALGRREVPRKPQRPPRGVEYVVVDGKTYVEFKRRLTLPKKDGGYAFPNDGVVTEATREVSKAAVEVAFKNFARELP